MKSKHHSVQSLHPRQLFMEWYHSTRTGQMLQKSEASYLLNSLQLTYNQKILQVGRLGTENEYIGDEFRRNFALLDDTTVPSPFNRIRSTTHDWPIACESIDVLVIPHLVEFETDPHRVLGEADRVLKPEGRLLILGFNPWSLHGMLRYLPQRPELWNRHFVGSQQLMDWLNLLKFETEFGAGFGVTSGHAVFEPQSVWRRSLASLAAAYAVKAIKRTWTPIPIKPAWLRAPDLLPDQVVAPPLMRKTR